jgi:hypothetical protein
MLSLQFAKNNEASTLEQQVIVFPRNYQWVALFAPLLFLWWGFVRFFIFKIENRYLYFDVGWVSILQSSYVGLLLQCDIAIYMLT